MAPELAPEPLVGRYELRAVLGRGGVAVVHDGWDTRLDRPVAIKLLHPAYLDDAVTRRRFTDEARAAAGLNHPNIVAVYDFGDHGGVPFLVMERLDGRTLADDIAAGPMPPARVRAVLDDVLGALAAAHAAGVVHRDVKPSNVLVAPHGDREVMKVADFGIAKTGGAAVTFAHTLTGQIVGTLAYMSPERVAGAPASTADDLYAVGVLGYEALTGRRSFPQENPAALLHAILHAPPPPLAALRPDDDPVLTAVIDRATAREPGRRFGTAHAMRAALDGAVPAQPAPARPATKVMATPLAPSANYFVPPAAQGRPMSRERKLLMAAAAFVGLVIAVLALALDPSSTSQAPEPISTSTTAVAPPPPPPPPTTAAEVLEPPKGPKKKQDLGNGNGRGNGNKGNEGRRGPGGHGERDRGD